MQLRMTIMFLKAAKLKLISRGLLSFVNWWALNLLIVSEFLLQVYLTYVCWRTDAQADESKYPHVSLLLKF